MNAPTERLKSVKTVIAVASGKGGVGKSTVSVNLALALQKLGQKVGILDADIYGPSQHIMLGVKDKTPEMTEDKKISPIEAFGLKLMSFGFFVKPEEIKLLEQLNFELNRLGQIKDKMYEIEPLFRNTDFLSFDMSSVSSSTFVSNVYSTPNGFDGEEACRIARYAGISDKISAFGIFEYNQHLDKLNQGSQLISQIDSIL